MSATGWKRVAAVADTLSAEAIRHLLASEGVPAEVRSDTSLLGEARACEIVVPAAWVARAQAILAERQVSDAELERLALAQPGPAAEDDGRSA